MVLHRRRRSVWIFEERSQKEVTRMQKTQKNHRSGSSRVREQRTGARGPQTQGSALLHIPEPTLRFGFEQEDQAPRDGLLLFGPLDRGEPVGTRHAGRGTE